uniref:Phospholipase B1, membrane-associated n=1 Tax=Poecilia formosa TaxID=48698 RepID=A0A087YKL9_POEFO
LQATPLIRGLSSTHTGTELPCEDRSPSSSIPTSVHELRPADIKVVAAVGDSLTAGNGIGSSPNDILDVLRQYRGLSWCIGGDGDLTTVTTLPNILKHFNHNVKGYSLGVGNQDNPQAFLNQAVPGATSPDIPSQVRTLVTKMKNDVNINFESDWKLITIFIGGNDLCAYCENNLLYSVENYVGFLKESLDYLQKEVPRALVNLVEPLYITPLREMHMDASLNCPTWLVNMLCPCVVMPEPNSEALQILETVNRGYQRSLHELIDSGRYDTQSDFTVVIQPFLRDIALPRLPDGRPDRSYFSADCFHLSQKSQTLMARSLWNNMLEPVGSKTSSQDFNSAFDLKCSTNDSPFIRTSKNSDYTYSAPSSKTDPITHTGTELPCEDRSPSSSIPTSVHELRPADIKVVAAVGDSLTAGNGIGSSPNNVLDVLRQYRGLSWCIGGDGNLTTVTTLPNILKHFNHNVTGYSLGVGDQNNPQAFLNQAVPGAKSRDIPSQVRTLVTKMKNDQNINFESDWKLITIFIGGNDLCAYCENSLLYSVENYVGFLKESLDYLQKEVPRALVNLVEPLYITPLREMHMDASLNCPTWLLNILCPCVVMPEPNSEALQILETVNRGYQRSLHELIESGRYDTQSDFTVVIQPFLRDIALPRLPDGRPDRSYFSPDCFHLSQKAQTVMARSLWNNMLEPLGSKTSSQDFDSPFELKCSTNDSPFIRTYKNSDYMYSAPSPKPDPITNWGSDFSCNNLAPSESQPTSVHMLRPSDIQVVAALGDSLTAGTGAKSNSILDLNTEYKGVSWSIGGDQALETVTTLPNILKKFNPDLKGFSKGQGQLQKGFNMAVAGAKSLELPAQVQALIKAMKENTEVNFESDWKLVTIFIGTTDLCNYCYDQNNLSPKNFSNNLMLTLDMLYKEVPRVLVNLVDLMQVDVFKTVKKDTLGCSLQQRVSCHCVINPANNAPEIEELKRINRNYQTEIEYLISGDRYDGKEDFAVVLQPFFHYSFIPQTGLGEVDTSFFSADCFHLSERAHAEMAIGLWNNMLEPVGRKQAYNNFTHDRAKIHCPSEASPFIFTKANS